MTIEFSPKSAQVLEPLVPGSKPEVDDTSSKTLLGKKFSTVLDDMCAKSDTSFDSTPQNVVVSDTLVETDLSMSSSKTEHDEKDAAEAINLPQPIPLVTQLNVPTAPAVRVGVRGESVSSTGTTRVVTDFLPLRSVDAAQSQGPTTHKLPVVMKAPPDNTGAGFMCSAGSPSSLAPASSNDKQSRGLQGNVKTIELVSSAIVRSPEFMALLPEKNGPRGQSGNLEPKAPEGQYFTPVQQGIGGLMGQDGVSANASITTDVQFVEKVGYWLGADLQKAEISLDGLGLQPLEVSISLRGNEAQIAFRSDEVQTRDALANASEQLKDSLQRQGLVVSEVSVDTSNARNAKEQGFAGRQHSSRKDSPAEGSTEELKSTVIRSIPTKNTVDLFV